MEVIDQPGWLAPASASIQKQGLSALALLGLCFETSVENLCFVLLYVDLV